MYVWTSRCPFRQQQTIHSGLKIPVRNRAHRVADRSTLGGSALQDLQQRMTGVDFILVDEMSMIGQDLLGFMSIRVRQAVQGRTPDGTDQRELGVFGGLNLILVGDPMQLPPVGASPMWAENPGTAGHIVEGLRVWLGLNACVELTDVMLQMGPAQAAFRRALLSVAEGRATTENYNVLATRMRIAVTPEEAHIFDDSVRLFPTNTAANAWSWELL